MKTKILTAISLIAIPSAAVLSLLMLFPHTETVVQETNSRPEIAALLQTTSKKANAKTKTPPKKKYENEYVIFFSPQMADKTLQKKFLQQYKNVLWLQDGNFPEVVVVKIPSEMKKTVKLLRNRHDEIDLIIPNQAGLECHSE